MAASTQQVHPPWWINPVWYCLFFLLPFFLAAVYTSGPYIIKLGQKVNNLTTDNILLGVLSISMLAAGSLPFALSANRSAPSIAMPADLVNRTLTVMGSLSLACYVVYFLPLSLRPDLLMRFLAGDPMTMYEIRNTIEQIPGITSFMHADLPFFTLYSVATLGRSSKEVAPWNRRLFVVLAAFIVIRGIVASERLAIVEAAVAFGLPRAAFAWRPGLLRRFTPYFGIIGVFALFCIGEYFRSWQYYKRTYANFWDFITVRFFGYFSTSINNGAGIVTYYPPHYLPAETADGLYKFMKIFGVEYNPGEVVIEQYLRIYSTLEFNNYGGLYAPYADYGIFGGALFLLATGAATGWLYKNFLAFSPFALVLFPSWYLGLLDIIRVWTWGSSRFVPVVLVSALVAVALRRGTRSHASPRHGVGQ